MKKTLQIEAKTDRLDEVLSFVNENLTACGCPERVQRKIDLAVEEVYVNIAHYAYGTETGEATIVIEQRDGANEVEISFADEGTPFDPLKKEDPDISLPASERPIGGLGIFMVKKIADDVSYEYRDGRNLLTFIKGWEV